VTSRTARATEFLSGQSGAAAERMAVEVETAILHDEIATA
jgi:hypothetical protein